VAASSGAVVAALALTFAFGGARAATAGGGLTGAISSPATGSVVAVARPFVTGEFDFSGQRVDAISLSVRPTGGQPQASASAGCADASAPCGSAHVPFSWAVPALAYNGPYEVDASATGTACSVLPPCTQSTYAAAPVTIGLAVPPAPPSGLAATVDAVRRTVTLTWSRNSEPDMIAYQVEHRAPSSSTWLTAGWAAQPSSGNRVAFTDSATAKTGGAWSFRVLAGRAGADASHPVGSAPSSAVYASVPSPPAPTSSATSAGARGVAGGPSGSSASSAPAGAIDVAQFAALQARARRPPPPPPTVPDPGYQEALPYRPSATTATSTSTTPPEGSAIVSLPGEHSSSNQRRLLISLAVASILFVVGFQLRWVLRGLTPPT
jgi:hypothetical protein